MALYALAFSEKGYQLALKVAEKYAGSAERCGKACPLGEWTAEHFEAGNSLVFVGACGIAVRAIAPFVHSKTKDPAVVVMDEGENFVIPILSGHLGGANDLARAIARDFNVTPVLTTATDVTGRFAVDEWTKRQQLAIVNPGRIKTVSGALLDGEKVKVWSDDPIAGDPPEGLVFCGKAGEADGEGPGVIVTMKALAPGGKLLHAVPRRAVLGVGCRRGVSADDLLQYFKSFMKQIGLAPQALAQVASIDIKKDEPGINAFAGALGVPFVTYSAQELAAVPGEFSASELVKRVTGVDNVCERAAVLASGGTLICRKHAGSGITMALAVMPAELTWRWKDV